MRLIVFESANGMLNVDEIVSMQTTYEGTTTQYYKFRLKGGEWITVPAAKYTLDAIREAIATVKPYNPCGVEETPISED